MRPLMQLLFALIVALAFTGRAGANDVTDMRVIGDQERTRFVIDLKESPKFGILRLANPHRLVVDLPNVDFGGIDEGGTGRGLISDYRYGLIAPGKARVVLDLSGPVDVVNTFVLDPVGNEPARLVVDLVPTSEEAFAKAAEADRPKQVARTEATPPAAESRLPVVVIDPGHGGIDSGAVGSGGLLEKDVTLQFARELQRRIREGGKLEPRLTRDTDTFISLGDRVEIARHNRASLFVSIHADTVKQDYVHGATVYTLSDDASDELSKALAEQENRSDILAGLELEDAPDDVADILFDLARRETRNLSVRFAKNLVDDMRGEVALNANPWRRASFRVLKAPEVPSVLLELGYLSSPEDEKLFRSKDWPANEAETVARAIEAFFENRATAGQ